MLTKIRQLIPNELVNYAYHLPLAVIANLKYSFPSRAISVIGITGTDGKTTTTNMVYQILRAAGKSVSMVSTINAEIAGKKYDTGLHVTNPDPEDVQKFLNSAVKKKNEFMVFEVTSHGLAQFRVWGVRFEVGIITNITHEHLDYHGNFDNYLLAKARLIKDVRVAVLNRDDPSFARLASLSGGKVVSFGLHHNADYNPHNYPLSLKIPGDYNILNALGSAAATSSLGIDPKIIKKTLENFQGLTGRMEEIDNKLGVKIIVDFAHTPNALEVALQAMRPITSGRLIAVFGCAGLRDVGKRPMMGEVAGRLADITVLTDEDPRTEDRNLIIDQIAQGAYQHHLKDGKNLFREPDRTKAIKLAISLAKKGDTVGIFGKGHERSMNYQGEEKPWSDQEAARQVLRHG